jgi:hypothetical protein
MTGSFKGKINVDIKDSVADWDPFIQDAAPEGAPNVVYVVLDDVGFAAMEPYGGLIETPNIKRLAERGLTYTNFHTTALCSPTRSCLMTGATTRPTGWRGSPRSPTGSRTPTATSRASAQISPRSWSSTAGTPTRSGNGT